jgi:hypothetical protein
VSAEPPLPPPPRQRKFRQAAFAYLHVGLLYEFAAYALWRRGFTSHVPGNPLVWFVAGAMIVAVVFWALWSWQNPWFARLVWAVHGLRLPTLIDGAFLRGSEPGILPPSFYLVALVVIVANLWMLARAAWDL